MLDGGIRRGSDVVTAVALGADAVMFGRPYVFGLAVGGEAGAARVVELVTSEIDRVLALLGVASLDAVRGRADELLVRSGSAGSTADRALIVCVLTRCAT